MRYCIQVRYMEVSLDQKWLVAMQTATKGCCMHIYSQYIPALSHTCNCGFSSIGSCTVVPPLTPAAQWRQYPTRPCYHYNKWLALLHGATWNSPMPRARVMGIPRYVPTSSYMCTITLRDQELATTTILHQAWHTSHVSECKAA